MAVLDQNEVRNSVECTDEDRFYIGIIGFDIRFVQRADYLRIDVFERRLANDPLDSLYVSRSRGAPDYPLTVDIEAVMQSLTFVTPNLISLKVNRVTVHLDKTDSGIEIKAWPDSEPSSDHGADFTCSVEDSELSPPSEN